MQDGIGQCLSLPAQLATIGREYEVSEARVWRVRGEMGALVRHEKLVVIIV